MNKSHKRIIKKFNKFLNDGVLIKNDVQNSEGVDNNISCMPGMITIREVLYVIRTNLIFSRI